MSTFIALLLALLTISTVFFIVRMIQGKPLLPESYEETWLKDTRNQDDPS